MPPGLVVTREMIRSHSRPSTTVRVTFPRPTAAKTRQPGSLLRDSVIVVDVDDKAGAVRVAADLRRAVVRLGRRLRMERQQGALSANKLSVLAHLYERGPSTPGQVAAAEHQHPQSLTRVFAELQLGGLVSRVASEDDLRASVLTLTPGGRRALRKDMAERDAWLADALGTLSYAEVEMLAIAARLIDRLVDHAVAVAPLAAQDP
jgi:DNA-binding MarR family transcriptional regulator